jgi:hypothetical protein
MTVVLTQDEGSRTAGGGTIASITAGVLVNTADLTTAAIGDIVEIFGSSTLANNSFFSIAVIAVSGGPDSYTLTPTPTNQGASGSARRLNRTNILQAAVAVTSFATLGAGAGAVNFLRSDAAAFVTSGVRRGDRVIVAGGGVNQGASYVLEVLSEDVLALVTVGGVAWSTAAVTTETVAVRSGQHRLTPTDEATHSWAAALAAAVTNAAPAAAIIERTSIIALTTPNRRDLVRVHGISRVIVAQTSALNSTVWDSLDEVVEAAKPFATGTGVFNYEIQSPDPTAGLTLNLGDDVGSTDPRACDRGSYWIGFFFPSADGDAGRTAVNLYGSVFDLGSRIAFFGLGAQIRGAIVRPRHDWREGVEIANLIVYGAAPLVPFGGPALAQNIVVGRSTQTGSIIANSTIIGLSLSDQAFSPFVTLFGGNVDYLDPVEDYDITDLADTTSNSARKLYTFNQSFTSKELGGPIVALTVEIYEVDSGGGQTLVFAGTTDANGQINAGAGVALVRQTSTSNVVSEFTHRLVLQGGGFRIHDEEIEMTSPRLGSYPVAHASPHYEGDLDE